MPGPYIKIFKWLIFPYVGYRIATKLWERFGEQMYELREMIREMRGKT